jgi:hypothetical protein
MIIDFHAHVGDMRNSPSEPRLPMTWERLIAFLDAHGFDMAVHLPVYNASPEGAPPAFAVTDARMSVHDQVLDSLRFPDRIIPFGNVDPRWGGNRADTDFAPVLDWFVAQGCRGVGEVTAHVPFDDARVINLFRQCGDHGLFVTIESTGMLQEGYGLMDEPGMPRLERLLRACPLTTIIGHGPGFWSEMSADVTPEQKWAYPCGPLAGEGATWRLLRECLNLYADLSAMSGYNAITRDPQAGVRFLNEFRHRLLFGTDTCFADAQGYIGHREYLDGLLAQAALSATTYDSIMAGNALRLLGKA